jgi:hypothetical protein
VANREHMVECFLCKQSFRFGPQVYDGRPVRPRGIMICRTCNDTGSSGLVPGAYPRLVPYLRSKGLKISLNAKGRIDLPG